MAVTRTISADASHVRGCESDRGEYPRGERFSRSPDLRREREQLRRVPRLRDDGVGVSLRSRGARRLRNPARREQHLCLVEESQFRSLRISEQRPASIASGRSTSPGIRSSRNTFSIPTIIRCSIRSGDSTRMRSSWSGGPQPLLEWDDRIPSFDEVHQEALKANQFVEKQFQTAAA